MFKAKSHRQEVGIAFTSLVTRPENHDVANNQGSHQSCLVSGHDNQPSFVEYEYLHLFDDPGDGDAVRVVLDVRRSDS
jgi:hypothetical protein